MQASGVALITGSAQGIGRAIALRLAKDGFDIALNDIPSKADILDSLKEEISNGGRKVSVILADVRSDEAVRNMIDQVVKDLGSLDVMVANAGVVLGKPFLDTTTEEWENLFSVNIKGVFHCYKYAAKQMIAQGRGGRIIGASSVAGKQGWAFLSAYSASKFAVRGLTHSAAKELAPHGITVNAYAPGIIQTKMMDELGDSTGNRDALFQLETDKVPLKRFGTPDEVASLVSYLASKEASYITGQSMSVNGGSFSD